MSDESDAPRNHYTLDDTAGPTFFHTVLTCCDVFVHVKELLVETILALLTTMRVISYFARFALSLSFLSVTNCSAKSPPDSTLAR